MKKVTIVILPILLIAAMVLITGATAKDGNQYNDESRVKGHVIVRFKADASEPEKEWTRGLVSGRKGRHLKRTGLEKIHLPPGWDEEKAVERLGRERTVESVSLDQKVSFSSTPVLVGLMPALVPDDAQLFHQWYLDSPASPGYFTSLGNPVDVDVDIDAPEGWAVMDGMFSPDSTAIVGIIDSGCGENGTFHPVNGYDPNHVDLPGSVLFTNASELPADGDDGSDFNTFEDDANGWDFLEDDNTPADDNTSQRLHGTLISGIIGADWDNGQGVAGIGKGHLDVLPLRFGESFFDVVAAVEYAMDLVEDGHPVRVINMSFVSDNGVDPTGLLEAVSMAGDYGIAVVAAAGNRDGDNNDDYLDRIWPAEYTRKPNISNVLAVAATGENGTLSDYSNIGPTSVQIAAPGDNIFSTYMGSNQYVFASGTSFSTPIAGAVLGLVMTAHPGIPPAEAINRVVEGGDFDARLAGLVQSGKRVNLAGALAPFYPYSGLAYLGSTVSVTMYTDTIGASYGTMTGSEIDAAFSTGPDAAAIVAQDGGSWAVSPIAPGIAQFTLFFDGSSSPAGTYDTGPWRVTAIRPFSAQVRIGQTVRFTPLMASDPSWAVTDTTVATISSDGVLTGLSEGRTRVILLEEGVERDYSGWILVQSSSAFSRPSSGGCGTTTPQNADPWTGPATILIAGLMLYGLKRRWITEASSKIRVLSSEVERGKP